MNQYAFVNGSSRKDGNSLQLARYAASFLPEESQQTWLNLRELDMPQFEDIRHSIGVYPAPQGDMATLLEATLAATDLVMVTPLYWYTVSAPMKLYLDHWSAWMRVPNLNFKPRMNNKRMWAVSVSSGKIESAQAMFKTLELCAEYMGMKWQGVLWGNGSKPGDIMSDQDALNAAKNFF
ncbi:MAG: NAD(P)H-dependent oxidoreductase [Ardenticatenaceae bacterium]|nr:NAD(P)H-dependent oxidoreductase [Ardenticatenaceae bacterium]